MRSGVVVEAMNKILMPGLALSLLLAGCLEPPLSAEDVEIIVPGCDGPPSDPHRVCDQNSGGAGGGGSGGGSSGGGGGNGCGPGQVWNFGRCVAMCPNPTHLRYPNGACNYPPGAICVDADHDYGTCRVDDAGWCVCPGD